MSRGQGTHRAGGVHGVVKSFRPDWPGLFRRERWTVVTAAAAASGDRGRGFGLRIEMVPDRGRPGTIYSSPGWRLGYGRGWVK